MNNQLERIWEEVVMTYVCLQGLIKPKSVFSPDSQSPTRNSNDAAPHRVKSVASSDKGLQKFLFCHIPTEISSKLTCRVIVLWAEIAQSV